MPFTPFHLGPALLIGLLFFPFLDLVSLLVSSVIVDVEPLYLMTQHAPYLHGFFHSYIGGTIIGILVATGMYPIRSWLQKIIALFGILQRSSFHRILFTSILGAYSHILLDSFLYGEMKPFYPWDFNPFLNAVSALSIYGFCSISFILGLIIYAYRATRGWRTGKSIGLTTSPVRKMLIIVMVTVIAFGLWLLMSSLPFWEPKLRVNLHHHRPVRLPQETFLRLG